MIMIKVFPIFIISFIMILQGCSSPQTTLTIEEQKANEEKVRVIVENKLRSFYLYGLSANDFKSKNGSWPNNSETLTNHTLQLYPELSNSNFHISAVNELRPTLFNIKINIYNAEKDKSSSTLNFNLQTKSTNNTDKPDMHLSFDEDYLKGIIEKSSKQTNHSYLPALLIGMAIANSFNNVHSVQPISLSGSSQK